MTSQSCKAGEDHNRRLVNRSAILASDPLRSTRPLASAGLGGFGGLARFGFRANPREPWGQSRPIG